MIAALPLIFEGVKLFAGLFDEGKEIVEAVTGSPSKASTPADLEAEVRNMSPEHAAKWQEAMSVKLEQYKAETDRLMGEQGEVNAATLGGMDKATAGKVAYLRMTTRPWCVRWALRTLIFPIWAVFCVDIPILLHNALSNAFSDASVAIKTLAATMLSADSGFVTVYTWFAPSAVSIVMTYMTLRQIGKNKGQGDGNPSVASLISKAKGLYERVVQ